MSDAPSGAPETDRPALDRRAFLWGTALATAIPIVSEGTLARARLSAGLGVPPPDAVVINANENPLGPCKAACEAIANIAPHGGRYDRMDDQDAFIRTFAEQHGLKPENVLVYAGSSEPLHYTVLAFTSPSRGLVTADPSYESAVIAANYGRAPVHKVALTSTYAHDVKAMVAADPSAGVIYICNPNNPTGTITPREDILWALENKPKGSILLVDEAYIHLSDAAGRAGPGRCRQGPDRPSHLLQDLRHGRHPLRRGDGPAGPAGQAAALRPEPYAGHRPGGGAGFASPIRTWCRRARRSSATCAATPSPGCRPTATR